MEEPIKLNWMVLVVKSCFQTFTEHVSYMTHAVMKPASVTADQFVSKSIQETTVHNHECKYNTETDPALLPKIFTIKLHHFGHVGQDPIYSQNKLSAAVTHIPNTIRYSVDNNSARNGRNSVLAWVVERFMT